MIQCPGSGRAVASGFAKRFSCPSCRRQQDVTSAGRIRKHMKLTTKARLRKGRIR